MSMKCGTTVVNIRDITPELGDVYTGHGSIWGNPFYIGYDGTRKQVVDKYRAWIMAQPQLLAALPELIGKRLVCHCSPLACHGDILLELLETC